MNNYLTLVAGTRSLVVRSLNRVQKIFEPPGTTCGPGSHPGSRLFPPAPLTGDVGRDCGDASRALLFCAKFSEIPRANPDGPATAPG